MSPQLIRALTHPRTGSFAEIVYAAHGIVHADAWGGILVFFLLLIVAVAHFVWAGMEM